METVSQNEYTKTTFQDIEEMVKRYVPDDVVPSLLQWASDKAFKFQIKNIINTKSNIEETKFEPKNNIGIEYSKDVKNKLSYRNKPSIVTNTRYEDICNMIKTTNGAEKEILRHALFAIKCIHKGVEYDIDKLPDVDYVDMYFNVLDQKHNTPCPNCKSKNTIPVMIQTRAADEPPLVRHACRDCKKHFKPPRFRDVETKQERYAQKEDVRDDDPSPDNSDDD
uniref:DNA-directed RNA polymerase 30 kDa polypeptide n=1 Tax=Myxoma virus TaxID=10273 RepID=D2WMC1_9POXV|nr:M30L [Myxoma virus]